MTPTIVVDDNNNCDGGRLTERASERAQEGRQASRAERESAMPRLAGWLARSKDELVRPIHPIYNLRDVNGVDGHNGRQLRLTRSSLRRAGQASGSPRQTNKQLFVYLFISLLFIIYIGQEECDAAMDGTNPLMRGSCCSYD
eukprot:GHVU01109909.1.p1 GENE.GHVU01109909.1~~GHVU01109909.1.p1  ORF type:complete len:142 (+),score=14.53 GHVU01109909.1:10-435(+)